MLAGMKSYVSSEYSYVADYFKGKHWKDITLPRLRDDYPGPHDACLSFMSPEAFRFYLPAYMVITINDYKEADTAGDAAMFAVTPPADRSLVPWWQERISGFNAKQRSAIRSFLEYVDEKHAQDFPVHGPKDALFYWDNCAA